MTFSLHGLPNSKFQFLNFLTGCANSDREVKKKDESTQMHFLLNSQKFRENVTLRWEKRKIQSLSNTYLKTERKNWKINVNYFLFVSANTFDEFFNRNTFSLHFGIFRVIFGVKDLIIFVLQDILHHEIRWLLIAKSFPRLKKNKNGSFYLRFKVCK